MSNSEEFELVKKELIETKEELKKKEKNHQNEITNLKRISKYRCNRRI